MNATPESSEPVGVVHVVDDDADMLESLRFFFEAHWLHVRTYPSADAFAGEPSPDPGCLIVDLRMPGLGGLALMQRLTEEHRLPPTIVLTAHGDVESAVKAMKLGAVEFLAKPHDSRKLLASVKAALAAGVERAHDAERRCSLQKSIENLTPREREIFAGMVAGQSSRQIAQALGLQPKSVEVYRSRVLDRLGFCSSLELVSVALRLVPELASTGLPRPANAE